MSINANCGAAAVVVATAAYVAGDGSLRVGTSAVEPSIVIEDLPTSDPHQKGQLWNNAGAIKISAG